jgi:hypothetical protein
MYGRVSLSIRFLYRVSIRILYRSSTGCACVRCDGARVEWATNSVLCAEYCRVNRFFAASDTEGHVDTLFVFATARARRVSEHAKRMLWTHVHLTDGSVEAGVLHTVDPETSNIVLLRPTVSAAAAALRSGGSATHHDRRVQCASQDRGPRTVSPLVIFGGAIARVEQNGVDIEPLEAGIVGGRWHRALPTDSSVLQRHREQRAAPVPTVSAEYATSRRAALLALLTVRRVPVTEPSSTELLVLGCLHIAAPYTADTITCENEIVLERFCTMLRELEPAVS